MTGPAFHLKDTLTLSRTFSAKRAPHRLATTESLEHPKRLPGNCKKLGAPIKMMLSLKNFPFPESPCARDRSANSNVLKADSGHIRISLFGFVSNFDIR